MWIGAAITPPTRRKRARQRFFLDALSASRPCHNQASHVHPSRRHVRPRSRPARARALRLRDVRSPRAPARPLPHSRARRRRLVTVFNNCPHQVDPAFYPAVRVGRNTTGGFALQAFYETVVVLPDGWSGRMWGRTNCTARGVCATGQCFSGGENCTSPAPAGPTLAQFTLNGCARPPCALGAADGAQIREPRLLQPVHGRRVQHPAPDRR
jgi:hypothetical protein